MRQVKKKTKDRTTSLIRSKEAEAYPFEFRRYEEMTRSEVLFDAIKRSQEEAFQEELQKLRRGLDVLLRSPFRSQKASLNDMGLIELTGRFTPYGDWSGSRLIAVPRDLFKLIAKHEHEVTLQHTGTFERLLNECLKRLKSSQHIDHSIQW